MLPQKNLQGDLVEMIGTSRNKEELGRNSL